MVYFKEPMNRIFRKLLQRKRCGKGSKEVVTDYVANEWKDAGIFMEEVI